MKNIKKLLWDIERMKDAVEKMNKKSEIITKMPR